MPITHLQGARVSYSATGAGEPVVLLHSSACSSAQWRRLSETLSERFRVIAPDLVGYGGSDPWAGPGSLRLSDEAALVGQALADDLGPGYDGPLHLVGHSYGGAVALHVAQRGLGGPVPAKLTSLTLIEPVAFHLLWNSDPNGLGSFAEIRRLADDVTLALAEGDGEAAMSRFVDYWNGAGAWSQLGESQRAGLLCVAPKIADDFLAVFSEPAGLANAALIEAPSLLICGGDSPKPTRRVFEMLAGAMRASRGVMLKGAGHMSPLTHGAEVNAAVKSFLTDQARPRDLAA